MQIVGSKLKKKKSDLFILSPGERPSSPRAGKMIDSRRRIKTKNKKKALTNQNKLEEVEALERD